MLHKKINRISSTMMACGLITLTAMVLLAGKTYAANAGCYGVVQGTTYSPATCPAGEPYQSGVAGGKCYVAPAAQGGMGAFQEKVCSTFEVGPAGNPSNAASIDEADGQKIYNRLGDAINFLSALVGIVVVASIIMGGIQYSTAGSDPQKVSAAKNRIFTAVLALVAFIFVYALLNWLVPGGVF